MAHLPTMGKRRAIAEINVVPFIDVMLVLLVIFVITAPLLTQGVKVELPKTDAKAIAEQNKEPIIVTVDEKGQFYLNLAEKPHEAITARTLDHLVRDELSRNNAQSERPVLVRGDKRVDYGKVVEAMVLLQQAGAKSVGLITEPGNNKKITG
jgi:biopolymer transport protein TolR